MSTKTGFSVYLRKDEATQVLLVVALTLQKSGTSLLVARGVCPKLMVPLDKTPISNDIVI